MRITDEALQLPPLDHIDKSVAVALGEDIGTGDVTAGLVPEDRPAQGSVIIRRPAVLCGCAWFDSVFRQLDPAIRIHWHAADGDALVSDSVVCDLRGPARPILTGERTALNFLQTLSGTAAATRRFADAISDYRAKILDTRKTLPGLRLAQKYAVRCGGGYNHRTGLYDGILIKENHIVAAGSIESAVAAARKQRTGLIVEVEVENLDQASAAIAAGADRLLLDNFPVSLLATAVDLRNLSAPGTGLEASGGITLESIAAVAATGVDYISVGALTKDVLAADYSLRLTLAEG